MKSIFGTDIGGVLAPSVHPSQVKFIDKEFLRQLLPIQNAFDVVAKLAKLLEPKNTFVVSYCDRESERYSRIWLDIHGFHEITEIPVSNLFYCRERTQKYHICNNLGITDFIDDNIKVLGYLKSVGTKYLFRNKDRPLNIQVDPEIKIVNSWSELEKFYF